MGHRVRQLKPEPSEHPAPDSKPRGVVGLFDNQPVSEPLEQSKTCDDLVPKPAPSELAEHSMSNRHQSWGEGLLPGMDTQPTGLPGVTPEPQQAEDPSRKDQPETTGNRPESGEAIVVGAIG